VSSAPRFLTETFVPLCPETEAILILLSNYVVSRYLCVSTINFMISPVSARIRQMVQVFGNQTSSFGNIKTQRTRLELCSSRCGLQLCAPYCLSGLVRKREYKGSELNRSKGS
jgi:hypothetical protein